MSVHADYKPRTIAELADEAFEILIRRPGLGCGSIGNMLFGGVAHINGSAPYARLAGKAVRLLEREGRAVYRIGRDGYGGWHAIGKGTKS